MSPPEPYYSDESVTLFLGKCEKVLPDLPANSVDAIVTDPPAAIAFMGRDWDSNLGGRDRWVAWLAECMEKAARVLKPGGHLLVWSLPRTSGWTQWALEDAGLEVRDCIVHLFGSGFPKSLDVSKAIDKAAGAERPVIGKHPPARGGTHAAPSHDGWQRPWMTEEDARDKAREITAPATEDAARWDGWGTALKPGQEMWWLARKPFRGSVAANVLEHGTGALNVDGCKVGATRDVPASLSTRPNDGRTYGKLNAGQPQDLDPNMGRWPPNIVFTHSAACESIGARQVRNPSGSITPGDGRTAKDDYRMRRVGWQAHGDADGLETVEAWACASDCPVGEVDRQSGDRPSGGGQKNMRTGDWYEGGALKPLPGISVGGDAGGASRFYPTFRYQAKAPASERPRLEDGTAHETVKSLGLMTWLVRLITPPGGTVLDMFAGSGPVGEVCVIEGFRCVLIEQDPKSAELIKTRLAKPIQPCLFSDLTPDEPAA